MQIQNTKLKDVKIIQLNIHGDARGFFVERFNKEAFAKLGLPTDFYQDNHSRSQPGTLRGLHYQHQPAQGKLVGALTGSIYDVAVDIRPDSPTYGKHIGVELSDQNGTLLWIPAGFAHGFCVTSDHPTDVLYKTTAGYNPKGEGGITWNDPDLNITWPITAPLISERDQQQQSFKEYQKKPATW